jgi:hypothetical protein
MPYRWGPALRLVSQRYIDAQKFLTCYDPLVNAADAAGLLRQPVDRITDMKFFLRDLFWAVLVVAICSAWWIDHRDQSRYKRAIVQLKTLVLMFRKMGCSHRKRAVRRSRELTVFADCGGPSTLLNDCLIFLAWQMKSQ